MLRLTIIAALTAAVAFAVGASAGPGATHVKVPDVTKSSLESAYARLHRAGLQVTCSCRAIPQDASVTVQTPGPGTVVGKGTSVTIETSGSGVVPRQPIARSDRQVLPDLTGEAAADAVEWARAVRVRWLVKTEGGLRRGNARGFFGNFVVVGANPAPGTALVTGNRAGTNQRVTTVTFVVRQSGAGAAPTAGQVRVPNIERMDVFAAYTRLHRAGLRVTFGRLTYSTVDAEARVAKQIPPAGTLVARDSTVIFEPSYGPQGSPAGWGYSVTVPALVGQSAAAAVAWARRARLYTYVDVPGGLRRGDASDLWSNFKVVTQDPSPGVTTPGTTSARFIVEQAS